MTAGVRTTVRCTACPWTGQRKDPSARPCPRCGSRVARGEPQAKGRPASGLRTRVHLRPLSTTVAALGPEPAKLAGILDGAAAAIERRDQRLTVFHLAMALSPFAPDPSMLKDAIARDIEAQKRETPDGQVDAQGPESPTR